MKFLAKQTSFSSFQYTVCLFIGIWNECCCTWQCV